MPKDEISISVNNLSKCYQIYERPQDRLKQIIYPRLQGTVGIQPKTYFREFWALKEASFEVKKGETIGIVGRNGSGKSTLLQMICGTVNPTGGNISTNGRVAALLELGSGFNPEFTGLENIYLNGAIQGLNNKDISSRLSEILAFADIGEFIHQPIKNYSSGMFVRLAFATHIMLEPEIMIVDEALSVGDMNFQAKCMTALDRLRKSGATILFVSHDIGVVKSLCTRAIWLDQGKLVSVGAASEIAEQYLRFMREEANNEHSRNSLSSKSVLCRSSEQSGEVSIISNRKFKTSEEFSKRVSQFRYGTSEVRVTQVELRDIQGELINSVEFNQEIKIQIYFEAYAEKTVSINVSVLDDKKNTITGCGFPHIDQPYLTTKIGKQYFAEYIFQLPLQEGNYSIRINISSPLIENESAEFVDYINDAAVFRMNRWEKARVWSQVHQFAKLTLEELEERS